MLFRGDLFRATIHLSRMIEVQRGLLFFKAYKWLLEITVTAITLFWLVAVTVIHVRRPSGINMFVTQLQKILPVVFAVQGACLQWRRAGLPESSTRCPEVLMDSRVSLPPAVQR